MLLGQRIISSVQYPWNKEMIDQGIANYNFKSQNNDQKFPITMPSMYKKYQVVSP